MHADPATPPPGATPAILLLRLGLGLTQGLALCVLSWLAEDTPPHPWVLANPKGFGLLTLLALLLPLPVLLGLGHLRRRVLAAWTVAAAALILLLGSHDLRQHGGTGLAPASELLVLTLGPLLFIGQALVSAADAGRRWWPRYPDCFEAAWRTGLQLTLAGGFVLGFWALYWVGATLFSAIGLGLLDRLGGRLGFVLGVTAFLAAGVIHLADLRPRLILAKRHLALGLAAWLTPVLCGLALAFLASLLLTGPAAQRGEALRWIVAAAALLVVLINAVYQDGETPGPAILRLAARLAAWTLLPLVALAAWGLAQRVGQYGLTEQRVIGLALLPPLVLYAVTYALAARGPAMRLLGPANIAIALLWLPLLAALNTPLADPARLTVRNQVARLLDGTVPPEAFDFYQLTRTGRDGRRALASLTRHPDPEIALRAQDATPRPPDMVETDLAAAPYPPPPTRLRALPDGTPLPDGLVEAMRQASPDCLLDGACIARPLTLAGLPAWLVGPVAGNFWAMRAEGSGWRRVATYGAAPACRLQALAGLHNGPPRAVPSSLPDLEAGTATLRAAPPEEGCR